MMRQIERQRSNISCNNQNISVEPWRYLHGKTKPSGFYLFKVNNKITRKGCKIDQN